MFKQLIITSMLSMGVANVTPILDSNTKPLENETIETNYDYTLTPYNLTFIENNGETINNNPNSAPYNTGTIQDKKSSIYLSSNYLNVKGNIYTTYVYKKANEYLNPNNVSYWANKNYYDDHMGNVWTPYTTMLYVMQITPYNYNKETKANINLQIHMEDMNLGQSDIEIEEIYLQRDIYITSENSWANFIDMNLTKNIVENIRNEIYNPNVNYFYNKTSNIRDITQALDQSNILNDEIEYDITPKTTNYLVIQYTPLVYANWNELGEITDYTYNNILTDNGLWDYGGVRIRGTNIIPDSTYEVIDIPGLMWEILTMPFAFISQAFNLTLFPGTPYQVNISNLLLSIIAIFVFIALISMFLKMKG